MCGAACMHAICSRRCLSIILINYCVCEHWVLQMPYDEYRHSLDIVVHVSLQ
jgi:hypothetical protein